MDTAVAAAVDDVFRGEKRERAYSDMGELLHSPSAALMVLVDCDHLNDFDVVCKYLSANALEVKIQSSFFLRLLLINFSYSYSYFVLGPYQDEFTDRWSVVIHTAAVYLFAALFILFQLTTCDTHCWTPELNYCCCERILVFL